MTIATDFTPSKRRQRIFYTTQLTLRSFNVFSAEYRSISAIFEIFPKQPQTRKSGKISAAVLGDRITASFMSFMSPTTRTGTARVARSFEGVDRQLKYGWGTLRLALTFIFAFCFAPVPSKIPVPVPVPVGEAVDWFNLHTFSALFSRSYVLPFGALFEYFASSYRWCIYVYIGSIGSIINVKLLSFEVNVILGIIVVALLAADITIYDYTILVYTLKTAVGDIFAGKVDSKEFILAAICMFALIVPSVLMLMESSHAITLHIQENRYIFLYLAIVQFFCEYGDKHWEQLIFFRHRYSFEVCNILLLVCCSWKFYELTIIRNDLLACLFYRISNYMVCFLTQDTAASILRNLNGILFHILGMYTGTPFMRISDPEVATLLMRQSTNKGVGLERLVAYPAWLPIISLESTDGDEWRRMRTHFDALLAHIPDAVVLQELTRRRVFELIAQNEVVIDADAVCRLTLDCFTEYLFGDVVITTDVNDALLRAVGEWKKEISVRGKGDMRVKERAVAVLIDSLLREREREKKMP